MSDADGTGRSVSVFVADEQTDHPVDTMQWMRLAEQVLAAEGVRGEAELSVLFVDEAVMTDLNNRFHGKDGPTDVLAFPMDELRPGLVDEEPEEGVLGDLVICPVIAERQADEARAKGQAGYTTADEIDLLTVHGILHLLGYDHAEPEEHREMFGLQARLLAEWQGARQGQAVPGEEDVEL